MTKAPVPRGVHVERLPQLLLAEVGPHQLAEVQLGVRHLPQQKVAQALFARGADEQVRFAHGGGEVMAGEVVGDDFLADIVWVDQPGRCP